MITVRQPMLTVSVTPRKFRIYALCLGAAAVLATIALGSLYPFAVAFGAATGLSGFIFEYAKRYFPGSCCSTALAAGGVVLAMLDWRYGIGNGLLSFYVQYTGVVLVCWAGLMFLVSPRDRTPV
jgi:hypothetical protein